MNDIMQAALMGFSLPKTTVHASFANRFDPVELTPGPLPRVTAAPAELAVVKHRVGYTMVELSNGDVIKLHLHVKALHYDAPTNEYRPEFSIIPEVVVHASAVFEKHEGSLS